MKTKFPLLLLVIVSLSQGLRAQTSSPSDEQQAQQAIIKLFDALSERDATALRNQCTADVRFYEYGQAWTADTLINKAITKNTVADFKRINKLDFISTTVKADVAWTTYNLHSDITSNGKHVDVYWLETVVLIREEKKWKVKVLHSSFIKKN